MPAMNAMDHLDRKAWVAVARFLLVLAIMIFGAAWTLDYWQGWLFWLVLGAGIVWVTHYFLRHDRALVERRMRAGPVAERRPQQRLIQTVVTVLLLVTLFVSVIDHRYGWSMVPAPVAIVGD